MRETYRKKYWEYFDQDGFIIKNIRTLPRRNSPIPFGTNDYMFEILKLDGDKEIRFAIQRAKDFCGCRNWIVDSSELKKIMRYLQNKNPPVPELFEEFEFNEEEEFRLRTLLEKEYDNNFKTKYVGKKIQE